MFQTEVVWEDVLLVAVPLCLLIPALLAQVVQRCRYRSPETHHEYTLLQEEPEVFMHRNVGSSWSFWLLGVMKVIACVLGLIDSVMVLLDEANGSYGIFPFVWLYALLSVVSGIKQRQCKESWFVTLHAISQSAFAILSWQQVGAIHVDRVKAQTVARIVNCLILFGLSFKWERTTLFPYEYKVDKTDKTVEDGLNDAKKPSPYSTSNWFMQKSCLWVLPLVTYAYKKKTLDFEDFSDSPDAQDEKDHCEYFANLWTKQKRAKKNPSLLYTVACTWGWTLMYLTIPLVLMQLMEVANNTVLQHCLSYLESGASSEDTILFYVVAFGLVNLSQNLVANTLWFGIMRLRLQIRYAFIHIIYKKTLRLSQRAKLEMTSGKVQSIISTDVNQITGQLEFMLYCTFAVLVKPGPSIYALNNLVQDAFWFASLGVLITSIIEFWLSTIIRTIQDKMSTARDKRFKLTGEVLRAMSTVKSLGWEKLVVSLVGEKRKDEVFQRKQELLWRSGDTFLSFFRGFLLCFITFSYYTLKGNRLTLEIAFSSSSWLWMLNSTMMQVPRLYNVIIECSVSFERIREYLLAEECVEAEFLEDDNKGSATGSNVQLSWYSEYTFESKEAKENNTKCIDCLKNKAKVEDVPAIDEEAPKISRDEELLKLEKRDDVVKKDRRKKPCYVFTCCGMLSDPYAAEKDTYLERKRVLIVDKRLTIPTGKLTVVIGVVGSGKSTFVAALTRGDLELSGSLQVHNTRGIALAAQKPWLLSGTLRSNILFGSSYDKERYEHVLKACTLTEDIASFPNADLQKIGEKGMKLSGGQQARVAMARCVYRAGTADMFVFDDTLSALDAKVGGDVFKNVLSNSTGLLKNDTRVLVTHDARWVKHADQVVYIKEGKLEYVGSYSMMKADGNDFLETMLKEGEAAKVDKDTEEDTPNDKVVSEGVAEDADDDEEKNKGHVSMAMYMRYFRELGWWFVPLAIVMMFALIGADTGRKYWLSFWVKEQDNYSTIYLVLIYGCVYVSYAIVDYSLWLLVAFRGYYAGVSLHDKMLAATTRAPMSFFWKTHSGKVINRFSTDLSKAEGNVYFSFLWTLYSLEFSLKPLITIGFTVPSFLLFALPVLLANVVVGRFYRHAEREAKRINTIRSSPMYAHFTETLAGTTTVRSFRQEEFFLQKSDDLTAKKNRAEFMQASVNFFGRYALTTLSSVAVVASIHILLTEVHNGGLTPTIAAFLVSFAVKLAYSFLWLMINYNKLEMDMVNVERVFEYIDREPEADGTDKFKVEQGKLEINNMRFQYKDDGKIVLGADEPFSLSIKAGERVGLVGRTGSGKSTVFRALLRLHDPFEGSISIDGTDITSVEPNALRSQLSCVCQECILFSATIRRNLDPRGECTDEEIWQVLSDVALKEKVENLSGGLNSELDGDSETFSVGEKQLFSLARALLRKSTILLLDEATANVDLVSDNLVQTIIRKLKYTTIVTIAHRISTVMDYDRVAVLSDGKLVEYDAPAELMKNPESAFAKLANSH